MIAFRKYKRLYIRIQDFLKWANIRTYYKVMPYPDFSRSYDTTLQADLYKLLTATNVKRKILLTKLSIEYLETGIEPDYIIKDYDCHVLDYISCGRINSYRIDSKKDIPKLKIRPQKRILDKPYYERSYKKLTCKNNKLRKFEELRCSRSELNSVIGVQKGRKRGGNGIKRDIFKFATGYDDDPFHRYIDSMKIKYSLLEKRGLRFYNKKQMEEFINGQRK